MSGPALQPEPIRFPLRRGGAVSLHAGGMRHPRSQRFGGDVFTAYADIVHLARGRRLLDVATRRGTFFFWRDGFREADALDALEPALRERIAAHGPDGPAQLRRMDALDRLSRATPTPRIFWILPALCLLAALAERVVGFEVTQAGFFSAPLADAGERWRVVTANLLHGSASHLWFNVMGLIALGALVERALGGAAFVVVSILAALAGMLAGWGVGYVDAVGASGVVFGLVGAMVWLEFRCTERIPASWRVPRRLLLLCLGIELMLPLLLPFIAGAAHLGGLAGGFLGAGLVGGARRPDRRAAAFVPAAAAILAGLFIGGTAVGVARVAEGGAALARTALRLEEQGFVGPMVLNNYAWLIATSHRTDEDALDVALRLARRAVAETGRSDPNVLDTLAEVHFVAGDTDAAVDAIDEAIELSPEEPYFREQRRRFTGEREADDRPDPPDEEPMPQPRRRGPSPSPGDGVTA